jgi:DNA-cytosine methyltransferase
MKKKQIKIINKLKVLSLFSGGGLGDLGLEMAGMEIAGQVEIDEVCQRLLKLRWPDVPKWGDIKNVKKEKLPKADVIAGGPPCQGFSVAGKQRGKADDRYLWPAMFDIIKFVKPRYVLFENVAGIVKVALDDVLIDLESEDYACWTFNIPACGINAPHKRERIWVIAYKINAPNTMRQRGRRGSEGRRQILECQSPKIKIKGPDRPVGGNAGYADDKRLQRYWKNEKYAGKRIAGTPDWETDWRDVAFKSCDGRVDDGGAVELDGFKLSKAKHRVERLKILGNGQVVVLVRQLGGFIIRLDKYLGNK